MGDTWQDIQDFKSKHASLKEKLARRKKERQEVVDGILGSTIKDEKPIGSPSVTSTSAQESGGASTSSVESPHPSPQVSVKQETQLPTHNIKSEQNPIIPKTEDVKREALSPEIYCSPSVTSTSAQESGGASTSSVESPHPSPQVSVKQETQLPTHNIKSEQNPIIPKTEDVKREALSPEKVAAIEKQILLTLDDATLEFPCGINDLIKHLSFSGNEEVPYSVVDDLLEKIAAQALIVIRKVKATGSLILESVDHAKVSAVVESFNIISESQGRKRKQEEKDDAGGHIEKAIAKHPKREDLQKKDDLIESLLSTATAKERENQKVNEEILELLSKPTAKEQSLAEKFKSQSGVVAVQEFCPYGTKEECHKVGNSALCDKLHFKKIIHKHTDENLGDCSFLNTCFHMDTCKYVHYEVDYPETQKKPESIEMGIMKTHDDTGEGITLTPPQWVQCDMRFFDFKVLGKFSVVMADPPWDIHMELPYGTMSDDEMRGLPVPSMQEEGYIFLWVTGRAMELGRECLKLWGYERVDELIWVKTNQLQRIIRTGRTGHWLNHGKEHCLIGVKGIPKNINRGLDCDVIVAEVRATSHKPDEVYGMIERLSPGTRKLELFGRPHNVQPNWVTLGNQVDGVKLLDASVVRAFNEKYPDPKMAMLAPDRAKKYYETGIID